jgi:hypothetical protein
MIGALVKATPEDELVEAVLRRGLKELLRRVSSHQYTAIRPG